MDNIFGLTTNYKLEPKRNNLFTIKFDSVPNIDSSQYNALQIDLISASRPTYTHTPLELPRFNMKYKVAGVPAMTHTIAVTFRDTIQLNLGKAMYKWNKVIFNRQNGTMGYASAYKTNASLDIFDPRGELIERWRFKGLFPQETNWGDLTYAGNGDPLTVAMTLAYDVAWLDESIVGGKTFQESQWTTEDYEGFGAINPNQNLTETPQNVTVPDNPPTQ